MKKIIALMLALVMVLTLAACSDKPASSNPDDSSAADVSTPDTSSSADSSEGDTSEGDETSDTTSDLKIGIILVHDENTGYDASHIDGIKAAAAKLGLSDDQFVWKYDVSENEDCYDTACDLVEQGCQYIISDSYGHQSYMQQAAEENPDVTFVSMTGDQAALCGLANFKNAFCHTYESRYVSGVVAGMKLAEMVANDVLTDANYNEDGTIKLGYVGAYPYAEVVSGYTAFYLGVKSIVDNVAMQVTYTNSWFDLTAEAEAANSLMANGCCIISQHADSTGAPSACQAAFENGTVVYCVGYNIDMLSVAPDAALTSAQNDWSVFYKYAFQCAMDGTEIATDWSEGYNTGANLISQLGASCAEGTAAKVEEVETAIMDGSLNVFDCSTFTVNGETVTSFMATDIDGDYVGDKDEAITDGVFYESTIRSAPYFSIRIDGIVELG